jgi:LmbE family N-acetylglucosaminyl deacetylase
MIKGNLVKMRFYAILCLLAANFTGWAQPSQPSSSGILLEIKKLNVLGSALYVAAHPDDENTRLIAYLSKETLVNTAYLAITRGDGGQNLIGPELREGLGLIRTQELLAARRVDGSSQFFTRANDFGYSKTSKETLKIWDRDQVLHDVVWAIRKFRPDVIITRFPPDARAGHGHHTSSAIMAEEAFDVAASQQYPNELKLAGPWQVKRLMLNSGRWWDKDIENREGVIKVDAGAYNQLLGESYGEMAARSRSMHKSQGFGSGGNRGESNEYLTVVKGSPTTRSIFDDIDITWNRVGHPEITKVVDRIVHDFNAEEPENSIAALLELRGHIAKVEDEFWRDKKTAEVEEVIFACSGLFVSAWVKDYAVVPGSTLSYSLEVVNRSPTDWKLDSFTSPGNDTTVNQPLENNQKLIINTKYSVGVDQEISGPYWLEKKSTLGMYRVDDLNLIGTAQNKDPFVVDITFSVKGTKIVRKVPLIYHWTDRVNGEMYRPVTVIPPVFLNLSSPVYIFNNGQPKKVVVDAIAGIDNFSGELKLDIPTGWNVSPTSVKVEISKKWQSQPVTFNVTPSENESGQIKATMKSAGVSYNRAIYNLEYDHIPYQIMLPKAIARAENLKVSSQAQTVGYIMGAGDNVPEALEQMGLKVWKMGESDITAENLSQLDVVVFGIRAANTLTWLPSKKPVIMEYMNNGGTIIMQYNTSRRIKWQDFAPYELTFTGRSSDSRVAEETAEITVLRPNHQVMNYPNKITQNDFEGWVQERGLYFPSAWSEEYTAILSAHDEDEEAKDGGLLIADYGKGHFVYTGYSWFRELPAGVPGAYRLFSNILSLSSQMKAQVLPEEESKDRKSNK